MPFHFITTGERGTYVHYAIVVSRFRPLARSSEIGFGSNQFVRPSVRRYQRVPIDDLCISVYIRANGKY